MEWLHFHYVWLTGFSIGNTVRKGKKKKKTKNKSVHPDVHWSGTPQYRWMERVSGSREGKGSWYPDVVTLHLTGKLTKKSMNIPYHLTCMKGFLCARKRGSVFSVFCWLHKRLATVLVEIVLYFPRALAPFHFFPRLLGEFYSLCMWETLLAGGAVA